MASMSLKEEIHVHYKESAFNSGRSAHDYWALNRNLRGTGRFGPRHRAAVWLKRGAYLHLRLWRPHLLLEYFGVAAEQRAD